MGPNGMTPEAVQEYLALLQHRGLLSRSPDLTPISPGGAITGAAKPAHGSASVNPMSERIMQGLLDYGPVPAQMATQMAMQPVTAGKSIADAIQDPTLGNMTNAGVQTGMALMPSRSLFSAVPVAGAGVGAGLLADFED